MIKTALYARYSAGPRQTDQSIEGQIRVCTDYCKQKGLTITEIYADRHISGKTDDRPEFQRLIADAKAHKFQAVVVYKTDRFARNKYDSAIYKSTLKQNGIAIYYAAEAIPEGPEGIILESLMEGLAEYYSAELAQKIKRGMHESALKCKCLGARPFGYNIKEDRTYEVNQEEAQIVNMLFDMYIAGETAADICKKINDLGFKTSRGNLFNKNSVNRTIQNEMYIGVYEKADVRIEDGMPAIVSKEKFYLAQRERGKRKVTKKQRPETAEYLLSGKCFCGYCGRSMIGVSGTGKSGRKFYYYVCPSARAKQGCNKKPISRDFIEDFIADQIASHVLQPDIISDIAQKLWENQEAKDTREHDIETYKKKLAENKQASNNIMRAIEKGLATETLLSRLDSLESERIAIEGELAYLKSVDFGISKEGYELFLRNFLKRDDDGKDFKKRVLNSFLRKVILYDDYFKVDLNTTEKDDSEHEIPENDEGTGFDQCLASWSLCVTRRTLSSAVLIVDRQLKLICKLPD